MNDAITNINFDANTETLVVSATLGGHGLGFAVSADGWRELTPEGLAMQWNGLVSALKTHVEYHGSNRIDPIPSGTIMTLLQDEAPHGWELLERKDGCMIIVQKL